MSYSRYLYDNTCKRFSGILICKSIIGIFSFLYLENNEYWPDCYFQGQINLFRNILCLKQLLIILHCLPVYDSSVTCYYFADSQANTKRHCPSVWTFLCFKATMSYSTLSTDEVRNPDARQTYEIFKTSVTLSYNIPIVSTDTAKCIYYSSTVSW